MLMKWKIRNEINGEPHYLLCNYAMEGLIMISKALNVEIGEIELIQMIPWEAN